MTLFYIKHFSSQKKLTNFHVTMMLMYYTHIKFADYETTLTYEDPVKLHLTEQAGQDPCCYTTDSSRFLTHCLLGNFSCFFVVC